ncbi:MAG: hydantoinase B/oxoprolinase family protein, partial [Candidatus Thorarchaeota archaeon]|nr:hydantoinase B/oxoprolinase family protein [Candidatus Thorarchaeota archaeon]
MHVDEEVCRVIRDPVTFEVIKNTLISCAREMSHALRQAAFSPNIKERRDCSCALFDEAGRLIAQSKDIPVHLGAMPLSVKACIERVGDELVDGTMALLNDPYSGGSHLPDLTLVAPICDDGVVKAYAANRAHHSDVGGISPGSMPGLSTSLEEEGVVIRPRVVVQDNQLDLDSIQDLLKATRTPEERLGDLAAQMAANIVGSRRMHEVAALHSWKTLERVFVDLRVYSATMMHNALRELDGIDSSFVDFMESDGAGDWDIPIQARVLVEDAHVTIDFAGTSGQVRGNINCPLASTLSSVYFVFLALLGKDIPTNEGCWSPLRVIVPDGSLLNPHHPAAVSAGNVETSQRVVDVVLGTLAGCVPDRVPAASQGTMNNLTIGGIDHRSGRPFTFYETIGGGAGASRGRAGTSGVHTNMTNTLNTPIEALEKSYPLRIRRYSLRPESGGRGQWRGGDGIVREIE